MDLRFTRFRRERDGSMSARFSADEAALLRHLVGEVLDLIDQPGAGPSTGGDLATALGITPDARTPDDPVLARLFPDGYADDPGAAEEFRRYTESGLRDAKRWAADVILTTVPANGGRIRLDPEQADAWLRALNDIRLALGTRLEVSEDARADLDRMSRSDPRYAGYAAYDWLTGVQDALVDVLS